MKTTSRWWWIGVALALSGCGDVTVGKGSPGAPGQPPARPAASTSAPSDSGMRAFALDGFQLDQTRNAAWKGIGFDLDGYDTAGDGTPSECMEASPTSDGTDGVDDRFGELLWPVMRGKLPSVQCEVQAAARAGHGTWLLQISRWNGTGDDASVTASVVRAIDGTADASVDCARLDANGELVDGSGQTLLAEPGWDGNDSFCVNPDSLAGQLASGLPLVRDGNAYVSGGALVMALPQGAVPALVTARSSMLLRLGGGFLMAQMDAGFQTVTRGVLGGRFSIANLTDVGPDFGVCDQSELATYYADYADIMATAPTSPDPSSPCDAISVGLAFEGVVAQVAGIADQPVPPPRACDQAGPSGTMVVPYPVEACCSELLVSDQVACASYWSSMP